MNFKWNTSFLLVVLIIPQLLSAQGKIWIKAPQMPLNEFKAHIKTLDSSHISYSQNQLQQKRAQAKFFQLKNQLLKAQEFYLSGEGIKAIEAFQKITQLAFKADWDEEDRRIILYSFLRMAQNEKDPEKRKALLLSAGDFASFPINSRNYPDHNLFPPPLIEELNLLQEKTNNFSLDWEATFPDHEIILINGRQMQKDKKTNLPQALYRVTALSSSHQPWSQSLNLSELITQTIKTQSLTKGSCENLQIRNEEQINLQILPFSDCPPSVILRFKKNQASIQESVQIKKAKFSNIPPWLIVGAGVVTLSIIISLNQNKKNKKGDYVY